ncbi:phosphate ABC transporter permease subunit PstC [Methanoregula sp.]|uniref:phosphate ABC transporter permease subunit PstC n=1 Tax=Methanoregula sp. TaxID=2052170 RepID=UPI002CADA472|nr:phosphate ABC transporter permease subunit PstC [Methanoregula sp.]HVP97028.1 phosphate ABC transporter permease subunit PstC [Methanoregula sp.]
MNLSRDPQWLFLLCASSVIVAVALIFGFILVTAVPAIQMSGLNLILGSVWDYNTHQYGMLILITGTLFLTVLTLAISAPVGILTAIYLSEYAQPAVEKTLRPLIELLVGIPSVVYGIFGFFLLEPVFRTVINPDIGSLLGFIPLFQNVSPITGEGYLLAATVLSIMILPTVIALSHESLRAVPAEYREGSFALGATRWETIKNVVIPAGASGIITSIVLGAMRAMGETMAVVMLIGGVMHVPTSILDQGYTITSKILSDSSYYLMFPGTRSAIFAMAIVLFAMEIGFVALIRLVSKRISGQQ